MKQKYNSKQLTVILLICAMLPLIYYYFIRTSSIQYNATTPVDLLKHPVYAKYNFNKPANVIKIGCQPLYSPSGIITETIKRDLILKKSLSRLNAKLVFYDFFKGNDVNFFLKKGSLDGGVGGDMPAITAAAEFKVIIPALIQKGFTSIVSNHYMLIEELKDKRIGYAFGSNAHYSLLHTLKSESLKPDQVRLKPMEVNKMLQALFAESLDAFSAWEPIPAITKKKYPDSVILHRTISSGYLYFKKLFSEQKSVELDLIVAAEIRAINWLQANRKNLLQACQWVLDAEKTLSTIKNPLSIEDYAFIAQHDIIGMDAAPFISKHDLQDNGQLHKEFKFLKRLKLIPSKSSWQQVKQCFSNSIIQRLFSKPEKYKLEEFNYSLSNALLLNSQSGGSIINNLAVIIRNLFSSQS